MTGNNPKLGLVNVDVYTKVGQILSIRSQDIERNKILMSGPRGRAVKIAVSKSLDHLTAVSGVGSSPALATCETSQVLLAGVPGVFSWGSPVFAHLLMSPSHMS